MLMTWIERDLEILAIAVEVPALVRIEAVFTAVPTTTAIVMTTRVILPIAAARRRKVRSVGAATTGIVDPTKRNNRAAAATANGTDRAKARIVTQGGDLMMMEPMEILIAIIPMNETHPSRVCNAINNHNGLTPHFRPLGQPLVNVVQVVVQSAVHPTVYFHSSSTLLGRMCQFFLCYITTVACLTLLRSS